MGHVHATAAPAPPPDRDDSVRLPNRGTGPQDDDLAVLRGLRRVALSVGVLGAATAGTCGDLRLAIPSGLALVLVAVSVPLHGWFVRGQRAETALVGSLSLLLASIVLAAALPALTTPLVVTILLVPMLALPHLRSSSVGRRLVTLSPLPAVPIILWLGRPSASPPADLFHVSLVGAADAATALVVGVTLAREASRLQNRLRAAAAAAEASAGALRDDATMRAWLSAIFHGQPQAAIVADQLGHITMMNPAAEQLTGWSLAAASHQHIANVVSFETAGGNQDMALLWRQMIATAQPIRPTPTGALFTRTGCRVAVTLTAAPIDALSPSTPDHATAPGGSLIYGGLVTIHDESLERARLARTGARERLQLLHDMLLVLANISRHGALSTAPTNPSPMSDPGGPPPVPDAFMAFVQPRHRSPRTFAPQQLLFEIGLALPRLLPPNVWVTVLPRRPVGTVYADPAALREVLLTFCLAPRHQRSGGNITFTVQRDDLRADAMPLDLLTLLDPGPYLRIDIADSAVTLHRDALLRLFDPTSSASARDNDLWLRLLHAYGLIRNDQGGLLVQSSVGRGSRFAIYLPTTGPIHP